MLNFIIKLFLVKEIISQEGVVHFRRYRLISTPWFNLYIHNILQSDQDRHSHDHPWGFCSLLLRGAYYETVRYAPRFSINHLSKYKAGQMVSHGKSDSHQLTLLTNSVWTLVFTFGKKSDWGYRLDDGTWIQHQTYRQLKNEGKLPL